MPDQTLSSSGNQSQNVNISIPCRASEKYDYPRDKSYFLPLTLEQHLYSYASEKPFQFLWSSWITEKEEYRKMLETVPATFSTYSSHTVDHSEVILTRIESLLGEDRIRLLSPTDTWLLLQCAYTHDLGMSVSEPEKEQVFLQTFDNVESFKKLLDNRDFINFLNDIEKEYLQAVSNPGNELFSSVRYLLIARNNNDDHTLRLIADRLKGLDYSRVQNMFSIVTTNYFRRRHAERTRNLLLEKAQLATDNGILPRRLRKVVAEIDYCHGGLWNDVLKLKQKDLGLSTDLIHPQFIAALLRLGDLLDLDSNRFNEYQIERLSNMPMTSAAHELKHMAISDFLVTPKEIRVTARYVYDDILRVLDAHYFKNRKTNPDAKKEDEIKELIDRSAKNLRQWFRWIEEEVKQFSNEWNNIIPENMTGSIASFRRSDIYVLNDKEPVEEDSTSLRYAISSSRSAQLIEGTGLYHSHWAFIREIVQNAVDASKRQLGRVVSHLYPKEDSTFPVFPEYYRNLSQLYQFEPVRVIVNYIPGNKDNTARLEFVFIDQGIGITYEKLKQMRHIGAISKSEDEMKELAALPPWLKPTGEFGIGMQSVFSVVDEMTLVTYPSNEEGKRTDLKRHIKLYCPALSGDIINREEGKEPDQDYCGTDVRFGFDLRGGFVVKFLFDRDPDSSKVNEPNPELLYAYNLKKNKVTLLDNGAVFPAIQKYIHETFTDDIIGLDFYFLNNVHPEKGWRELIREYEKNKNDEQHKQDISFRFPKLTSLITCIPCQTNFLSHPNTYINAAEADKIVQFWYNYESKASEESISVLLTLQNNNEYNRKNIGSVRLFYRGILICEEPRAAALFKSYEIPGLKLKINIMSGNVSRFLEINREHVKATGYAELNKIIRDALKGFYQSVSVWEAQNKQPYISSFWEKNPEHRLHYRLVSRFFNYDEFREIVANSGSIIYDSNYVVKQYSIIFERVEEIEKRISEIFVEQDPYTEKKRLVEPLWFTDPSKLPLVEPMNGNTINGLALPDIISDMFDLKYHRIEIVRSKEWEYKFIMRYTLTATENTPFEMTDDDYSVMCISMLQKYMNKYRTAVNEENDYLKDTFGNFIISVPAAKSFYKISVAQPAVESPGENLAHFNRFIILPFKLKDLYEYFINEYQGKELPTPIGEGRRSLFSDEDMVLELLDRMDKINNPPEKVKEFAKLMQDNIDNKIIHHLEEGLDKNEVYSAYAKLLRMFRYEPAQTS